MIGQRLVQHLGKKAEHRHAGVVNGGGERGTDDFKLIEADQFLPWPLGKPGTGHGHGFQRAAKALAAFERRLGHAPHLAVIAREKAHNQVGLMHRPGAQNHGF